MNTPAIACLGKLPIHGDFIRWNQTQVPEIVEFDAWLLEGMERVYGVRGRAFDADLRAMTPLRFLYTSQKSGRLLNGLVLPSADQVGRCYPFVIGFAMPAPSPGPTYDRLPLQALAVLQQLLDYTTRDLAGTSLAQFLDGLKEIAYTSDDNAAEQALRTYLLGTTLDALWAEWPGFQFPERRQQCLQELWQLSQPPFPPRYLTTIPMHHGPGEVAFWLTLLRQWLSVRANPVLLAWPAVSPAASPAGPGTAAPFRLLFDDLHGRYFEPAFWPARTEGQTLDLGRAQSQKRSVAPSPRNFAALLRPRALLQDVIGGAARV
ncbi:MAG TPA: type VI secretion system-associated protein TagF [Planctomycetota bacterium]